MVMELLLIGLVVFVALLGRVLHRWPQVAAWLMLALSLIGVLLPTWRYLTLRPYLTDVLGVPIGIGLGVWLNGAGHLLVTAVTAAKLCRRQLS